MAGTYDAAFASTQARLKKPGRIATKRQAAACFATHRKYREQAASHYHRYQTRGPGTMTGQTALAKCDAYLEAAALWGAALEAWLNGGSS